MGFNKDDRVFRYLHCVPTLYRMLICEVGVDPNEKLFVAFCLF